MRRTDGCMNCGETREIAGHGLCFKCYRRDERADDRRYASADRHNPGVRREHKKLFRGFTSVMVGLSDLGISKSDVLAVRRIMEPYLVPIATFLALKGEQNESSVNSEPKLGSQFTVHTDSPSPISPGSPSQNGNVGTLKKMQRHAHDSSKKKR